MIDDRTPERAEKPDRTPRIRRRLGRLGLGYLQVPSGAKTKKQLVAAERVIDKLIDDRQVGVLEALMKDPAQGGITVAQVVDLDRRGQLSGAGILASIAMRENLWAAVERLLPRMGKSKGTRDRYGVAFAALRRKGAAQLGDKATLASLGLVDWHALAACWGASGSDWNNMRRAVSRLLSLALGNKHHPSRHEIMDPEKFPVQPEAERDDDITEAAFWAIHDAAREDMRAPLVTLVLTGMRIDEYLACTPAHLRPRTCKVEVPGTKTEGSATTVQVAEEHWPWIVAAIPSPLRYKAFRRQWCIAVREAGLGHYREWIDEATGKEREEYDGPVLHSLRHAAAQWATDAGVPLTHVQSFMRHQTPAMTARYAKQKAKGEVAGAIGQRIRRKA